MATIDEPEFHMSGASGKAGDEITLNVTVTNNPGIAGYGLTMEYDVSKLTFVSASSGNILSHNFNAVKLSDNRINFNSYNNRGEYERGTVLFTITFKINGTAGDGTLGNDVIRFIYEPVIDGFAISEADGITPVTIHPVISRGSIVVEGTQLVTLINAVTSAKDFISIVETAKNSKVWVLTFNVTETYSNGEVRVVTHAIRINANNANVSGRCELGEYTLIYDIRGNGSNIKEFRVF